MANSGLIEVGPGLLFVAPLGTTEPAALIGAPSDTGFPTGLDVAWTQIGYTDQGSTIEQALTVNDVEVEEELEPVMVAVTKRTTTVTFAAAEITAANLQLAYNGGVITTLGGAGSDVTFDPPAVGAETRRMLLHVSQDGQLVSLFRRALQTGNVQQINRKAPQKRLLALSFRCEKPAVGQPWRMIVSHLRNVAA